MPMSISSQSFCKNYSKPAIMGLIMRNKHVFYDNSDKTILKTILKYLYDVKRLQNSVISICQSVTSLY